MWKHYQEICHCISIPNLSFFEYGVIHEHGDYNAALMYPMVFAIHGLGISIACYIIYYVFDALTFHSKWNILKNIIHCILFIALFWLPTQGVIFILLIISIPILAILNILITLYLYATRT
jgi:hypothetical protein